MMSMRPIPNEPPSQTCDSDEPPNPTCDSDKLPKGPDYCALAIVCGALAVLMGMICWLAWATMPSEFLEVHLLAVFGTSCCIWPVVILSFLLARIARDRHDQRLGAYVAVGLSCIGVGILFLAWALMM